MAKKATYSAQDIQILKGLEHVRKRPAMYIGGTDVKAYHHLLREVVDNGIDEHLDGHVTHVLVNIDTKTQVVEVRDNGRGIPVEKHPKAGISTLTAVFTKLHAGGKFGTGAYTSAVAGLHGIGVKAVNALSDSLDVWTCMKKGTVWHQHFTRGDPTTKVERSDRVMKSTGTIVRFRPDTIIFGDAKWRPSKIAAWLHDIAYLCPGIHLRLTVDGQKITYHESGGLAALLEASTADQQLLNDPILLTTPDCDVAVAWTDGEGESWRSFTNVISTPAHGTHVQGARKAITDALNAVGEGSRFRGEDLREGLVGAVHVRVLEPIFRGQTKSKLENPEVETKVYDALRQHLTKVFAQNPDLVKKLQDRAKRLQSAREKYKAEQQAIKGTKVKKGARGLLPHKLIEAPDCTPAERELFIVEGDSAGGSARAARIAFKKNGKDVHFQEVYPLRGKLTNAARKQDLAAVAKNDSIKDLFTAIGTGVGDTFDIRRCRYNTIFLLADADPDGRHIVALLLSLFAQHMPELIRADMMRVVQNPLFMGVTAKQRVYGDTVEEIRAQCGDKALIRRFKGLGESNPKELQEYAMDPKSREVLRVSWDDESDMRLILSYMGTDTEARRELLGIIE
jgi:DNA gyrase subunit B